jgi:hypothetical protein
MPLPDFDEAGELPAGVHLASLGEVAARFGGGGVQRRAVCGRLEQIFGLAKATGGLERFIIFGSFVTDRAAPNDVDIILIMPDDFDLSACEGEGKMLFEHAQAETSFGASIFWIRPALLLAETVDEFVAHWQVKRDRTRRGIVEVKI